MEITLTLIQVRTIENELMRQNGQKIIDGIMDEPITRAKLTTSATGQYVTVEPEGGEVFVVWADGRRQ